MVERSFLRAQRGPSTLHTKKPSWKNCLCESRNPSQTSTQHQIWRTDTQTKVSTYVQHTQQHLRNKKRSKQNQIIPTRNFFFNFRSQNSGLLMFITPTQTALPREILQNYPYTFAFFDFPQISNLMIPWSKWSTVLFFLCSKSMGVFPKHLWWDSLDLPRECRNVTSVTGGQPLFSTKRVRKALRLAEIAVNDLQSNFLSKTLYEFYVYMCIYIYIRLSTYNITFCMAMCQAEKGYW